MGRAKLLINELIEKKSQGNSISERSVKIKLILKGVVPDKITDTTPDTEELISKIMTIADEFNITLTS